MQFCSYSAQLARRYYGRLVPITITAHTYPASGSATLTRRAILVAAAGGFGLVAAGAAGCTDAADEGAEGATAPATSADSASAERAARVSPGVSDDADLTVVATAATDLIAIHEEPADPDDPSDALAGSQRTALDRRAETTGQLVFLVLREGIGWHEVQLPVRPNGTTGWVRAREVSLSRHSFAIDIALEARRLVVTDGGREVSASPIGLGTDDTPTPGGSYYVKELLQPPAPDGPYGPYAYGLSGFSNVLESFAGGAGVIGIHGTNQPELVGQQVSSGCIRVPNDVIVDLVENVGLPLGTPVTIRA